MCTLEKVYGLHIPETQTVVVVPSSNRDQPGIAIEESLWLQRLEDEGWRWVGQQSRNWHKGGSVEVEYLDVFRREGRP